MQNEKLNMQVLAGREGWCFTPSDDADDPRRLRRAIPRARSPRDPMERTEGSKPMEAPELRVPGQVRARPSAVQHPPRRAAEPRRAHESLPSCREPRARPARVRFARRRTVRFRAARGRGSRARKDSPDGARGPAGRPGWRPRTRRPGDALQPAARRGSTPGLFRPDVSVLRCAQCRPPARVYGSIEIDCVVVARRPAASSTVRTTTYSRSWPYEC